MQLMRRVKATEVLSLVLAMVLVLLPAGVGASSFHTWDFSRPSEYTYDSSLVVVSGGTALFKTLDLENGWWTKTEAGGAGGVSSTTNNPQPTVTAITPNSGVRTNNLLLLMMDGTAAIKDTVHDLPASMLGTPTTASLLGATAPVLTTGAYTSCWWTTASLGLTPATPVSFVIACKTSWAGDDGNYHLLYMNRHVIDFGMVNGMEIVKVGSGGFGAGQLVVATWHAGNIKSKAVALDATNWAANTTHIIVATLDADNNQRLFLDGVEGTISSVGMSPPYGDFAREPELGTYAYVGVHDLDGEFLVDGSILTAVYGRVLTDAEIMALSAMTVWDDTGFPVNITNLAGTNFRTGATVKLTKSGEPDITATNVTVVLPTQITCRFDLNRKTAGTWNVVVTNTTPGGGSSVQTVPFTINNPVPTTTTISPTSKTAKDPKFTLAVNGTDFINGVSTVQWNGSNRTTTYVNSTQLTTAISAADIASAGTASVTVFNPTPGGGTSNAQTFSINYPSSTWYLAEGTTNWGFSTCITIQNPNATNLTAKVTYMPTGAATKTETVNLPASSQTTLTNDHLVSLVGQTDFSTRVECTDATRSIAVDRTMYWTGPGASSPEGHSSVGVTSPSKTWYLPEGSTNWGFETWLLIQNPNGGKATCKVTYMIEDEDPVTKTKEVGANSRMSYSMAEDIGNKDASIKVEANVPVIPERAMYKNSRREGHDSIGTTSPATDYFLAEGTSSWGFTTYVLVQNPNPAPANVTVTYMASDGAHPQAPFKMDPNSRKTIRVNDALPDADFSTKIHADKPIIAERAMYWGEGTPLGEACHDSIGMSAPHKTFYLPDGQTSEGRETYTLIQNPNTTDVTVDITYMTPDGKSDVTKSEKIPASSRKTFNMLEHSGITGRAAIMVTSKTAGKNIMVERAMYWNTRGAGTDTIGWFSD